MGCELAIACIPLAKMTASRIQRLHEIVDRLDEEELVFDNHCLCSDDCSTDDVRTILHEKVDLISNAEDHWRDVNHLWIPELSYTILAAGGYTSGHSPSDLYEAFSIVEECDPVRAQLADWASEDASQKFQSSS